MSHSFWKDDWDQARTAMDGWWKRRGLAVSVFAPREEPWEDIEKPPLPSSLEQQWLDPDWRVQSELYRLSHTFCGGAAFPAFNTMIGPGSVGLFLGAQGHLADDTVWYAPCLSDPEAHGPLVFSRDHPWVSKHDEIMAKAKEHAQGRYLVGFPDLIENVDTLAQLRDPQTLLMDLVERPEWVLDSIRQINEAWRASYDHFMKAHQLLDEWGGTNYFAFCLWGIGLTAKVQCDFSCMISPKMFRKFVVPALAEQCGWLDNALYHLDGTQALPQLDALLEIETLEAIEWTPQAGIPGGGSPEWYDLYRKIRGAGKGVQAVGVTLDEVEPLIDAVGAEGLMIITYAPTEAAARAMLSRIGWPA